jgi:hypothetical protein
MKVYEKLENKIWHITGRSYWGNPYNFKLASHPSLENIRMCLALVK